MRYYCHLEVTSVKHESVGLVSSRRAAYSPGMEWLDGGSGVPDRFRGGIVALGNFDGFHLGHQAVVGHAVARARAAGRPALVGTFEPHPKRYFQPQSDWFRLTTMEQRGDLLAQAG